MKTITIQIDSHTYNELKKASGIDGRSVEELAAVSLWQDAQRSIEPSSVSGEWRPLRLPLILNGAVTFLIASLIIIQLTF